MFYHSSLDQINVDVAPDNRLKFNGMILFSLQSICPWKRKENERTQNRENVNFADSNIFNHAVWHSSFGAFTII